MGFQGDPSSFLAVLERLHTVMILLCGGLGGLVVRLLLCGKKVFKIW
jgi:hypothetical protein